MAYSNNPLNNYETEIVTHQSNAGNVNEQRVFKVKITPKNNAVLLVNDFKVDFVCSSGVNSSGDNLYPSLAPSNTPHLLTNTYQHFYEYDVNNIAQYSPVSMQFCVFTETGDTKISGQTSFAAKYPNIDQIIFYEVYLDDSGSEVNVIDETTIPFPTDFNQTFVDNNFWNSADPFAPTITNLTTPIRIEAIVYLNQNIQFPLTQDINVDFDFDQMLGLPILYGCIDPLSDTYNPNANTDDGSCEYYGCTDDTPGDFPDVYGNDSFDSQCVEGSGLVTLPNGTVVNLCDSPLMLGHGYANTNYDPNATHNPYGDCEYGVLGCTDILYQEYDPLANVDDGSCTNLALIPGCVDDASGTNPIRVMLTGATEYQWLCRDNSVPVNGTTNLVVSDSFPLGIEEGNGGYCDSAAGGWDTLTYGYDENGDSNGSGVLSHNQSYCLYCANYGCGDSDYVEYDANIYNDYLDDICIDNSLCLTLIVNGCMDDPSSSNIIKFDGTSGPYNYDPAATFDNGPYSVYYTNPLGGGSNCFYFPGCTDQNYLEYYTQEDSSGSNYIADIDDGTCVELKVDGCTDPNDANYNSAANYDDGSCAGVIGCTDSTFGTNPDLDGNCRTAQSYDVSQPHPTTYGLYLNVNTGVYITPGLPRFVGNGLQSCNACENDTTIDPNTGLETNPNSGYLNINYNPNATYDNTPTLCENCGCTDPDADNYDSLATLDDGSCIWSPGAPINIRPMLDGGTIHTATGNPYDFYERQESFDTNISGAGLQYIENRPFLTKTIFPHHYTSGLNSNFNGGVTLYSTKSFTHQNGREFEQYTGTIELFTTICNHPALTNQFDYESRAANIVVNPNSLGFSAVGCVYDATTNRWSGGTMPDGVEIEFKEFYNAVFPALMPPATDLAVAYLAEAFTDQAYTGSNGVRDHYAAGNSVNFLKTIVHFTNWPQNVYPPNTINDGLSQYLLNLTYGALTNPDVTDPAGVSVHMNSIPQFAFTYVEGCTDSTPGTTGDFPDINGNGVDGSPWTVGDGNGFESSNYNPFANVDDGSCNSCVIFGCTDPLATNYDSNADCDDGNCRYSNPPISDHDNCGIPTMGPFKNVNINPTLPESTLTNPFNCHFCICSSRRPPGSRQYFWWEHRAGFMPTDENINTVINKCDSGQYTNYPLPSQTYGSSNMHFWQGKFQPPGNYWAGFGCIGTDVSGVLADASPITVSNVDWFARGPMTVNTGPAPGPINNTYMENLKLPTGGSAIPGMRFSSSNSNIYPAGSTSSVVVLADSNLNHPFTPLEGDYQVKFAATGLPHPGSFQWEENPNSSPVHRTGKRAYWIHPMELVGPLWRKGFQRTSPSTGIVNSNGRTEKSFSSMYRNVYGLTIGDTYVLKMQIAVDAPSDSTNNYNYCGLGFEMDSSAQSTIGNAYDYHGQFGFTLGFADPSNYSLGGQTTINWIIMVNSTTPTLSGQLHTSCYDGNITFSTTGNYSNYCEVRGLGDKRSSNFTTLGNPNSERSLDHLFEVFDFEFPFTAAYEEHAVAITMTEGTVMHILNIHVETTTPPI